MYIIVKLIINILIKYENSTNSNMDIEINEEETCQFFKSHVLFNETYANGLPTWNILLRPGNMYEGRCFYKFVHGRFGGEEKIGHKFTFLVIEELNCHISTA